MEKKNYLVINPFFISVLCRSIPQTEAGGERRPTLKGASGAPKPTGHDKPPAAKSPSKIPVKDKRKPEAKATEAACRSTAGGSRPKEEGASAATSRDTGKDDKDGNSSGKHKKKKKDKK